MMEENLERTFSADPFRQMGGYLKRFRGLTIYGKLENPAGHRIEHIFTQEGEMHAAGSYEVAFVTAQGVPEQFGRNRRDMPTKAIAALRNHFQQSEEEIVGGLGRFIPV